MTGIAKKWSELWVKRISVEFQVGCKMWTNITDLLADQNKNKSLYKQSIYFFLKGGLN